MRSSSTSDRSDRRVRRRIRSALTAAVVAVAVLPLAGVWAAAPVVVEVRVGASGDDVEELSDGWLYASSSDLELTEDGRAQTVGLRFTGITVPRGATITSAWIQFTADERNSEATSLLIGAVDTTDAAPFAGPAGVSTLPLTGPTVAWTPAPWSAVGAAGTDQRTPDLAPLLQTIVSRPDWNDGNALALVITGTGHRTADSYDGSRTTAPLLHIEYTPDTPPPPPPEPAPEPEPDPAPEPPQP